jgi:hypothetical protein
MNAMRIPDVHDIEGESSSLDCMGSTRMDDTMTFNDTLVDNGASLHTIPVDWVPFDLLQVLSLAS